MPAQFDRDNMGGGDHWNTARDDDISGLPVDAQELYHRLTREGAESRGRLAHIDRQLQERIAQLSATHTAIAARPNLEPESEPWAAVSTPRSAPQRSLAADQVMRRAPRYPALRRWATLLATAAVVLAFVAVFAVNAGQRRPGSLSSHRTPTGATSPTSAPTTDWVDLTRLDYSTNFSANDFPAVAPSDSRVVYETMAQGPQQHLPATLRATSDGGVTWHTLPTPVPADHISHAGIFVSPTNAQTIFLTLADTTVADCPATSVVVSESAGYQSYCWIQYSSFDGGARWSLTDLPVASGTTSAMLTGGVSIGRGIPMQTNALGAPGQRLFAGYLCLNSIGISCTRLITSGDGGHTWRFADLPLLAGGAANVCDYTASLSSVDLYAVTSPSSIATCAFTQQAAPTLWHSVDAGATWTKVRLLATPNEQGLALAQNPITGARLLYLAAPVVISQATDKMGGHYPVFSQAPSDVKVSTDGGVTWQSAPTKGISSDHAAYFGVGLHGPLSDGSIVIEVIPSSSNSGNMQGSDLYAWKPGDSGWRLIGSVSQEMGGLLAIPAPTGDGDTVYAFLTSRGDTSGSNTYTILQKHVAP